MKRKKEWKQTAARIKCIYIRNDTHTHTKDGYFEFSFSFSFSTRFPFFRPYHPCNVVLFYSWCWLYRFISFHFSLLWPILFSRFILKRFLPYLAFMLFLQLQSKQGEEKPTRVCTEKHEKAQRCVLSLDSFVCSFVLFSSSFCFWYDTFCRHCTIRAVCNVVNYVPGRKVSDWRRKITRRNAMFLCGSILWDGVLWKWLCFSWTREFDTFSDT